MPQRTPDHIRAEVIRQYTTRLPDGTWKGSKLIGAEFGITGVTVLSILRQAGIERRSPKEAHAHGKRCGPYKHMEQFDEPPHCRCGCNTPVRWDRNKHRWCRFAPGHQHKDEPYKNADWLREQYETLRRSANEIAAEFGVNNTTVIRQMERHGIARRDASESKIGRFEGAKNPAWKGGVSQWEYAPQWKRIMRTIRKRDNHTCQICGIQHPIRSKTLHVHHIDGDKTNNAPDNLMTVCASCHPRGKRKEQFNKLSDPHWRGKWLVTRKGEVLGVDAAAYMTIREAADRLSVGRDAIHKWMRVGRLAGKRVGYFWYVERASFEEVVATYQRHERWQKPKPE